MRYEIKREMSSRGDPTGNKSQIEKGEKTETNVPKKGGSLRLEEDGCKTEKSGLP